MQGEIELRTSGPALYEFTNQVRSWLQTAPDTPTGLLTLFVQHSSCSLLIQENADADVQLDLMSYLKRLVPNADHPSMAYLRHTYEGPDDMPAHIKAALLPVSLSVPLTRNRLRLGTWQGIYLFEHRSAPKRRTVVMHLS